VIAASSVLGPAALLAGASRAGAQGIAVVVFADDTIHEFRIMNQTALVRAQVDMARFNALVTQASQDEAGGSDGAADAGDETLGRPLSAVDELAKLVSTRIQLWTLCVLQLNVL
jgi:hypothetical protein